MQIHRRLMIAFALLTLSLLTVTRLLAGDTLPLPVSKAIVFRNTSFEALYLNLPYLWQGKNLLNDRRVCNKAEKIVAYAGLCAFRFRADADFSNRLRQKIDFSAGSDTLIDFSLWVKTKALSNPASFIIEAIYPDGSSSSESVTIPAGTYAYTPVTGSMALTGIEGKLRISIVVPPGTGKLWVDDLTFQYSVNGATATPYATKTPIGQPTPPCGCGGE